MALTLTRSLSIEKIRNQLRRSAADLADARATNITAERRFDAAYDAGFRCALALLEANRLQSSGQGHHRETLEFMAKTLGLKGSVAEQIGALSRARNANRYDAAIVITEERVAIAITWAERVQAETVAWFEKHMPQALKS